MYQEPAPTPGNAQRVVAIFGGRAKMSEICDIEPHLPGQWERKGSIPYKWWLHICAKGQAAGINITPIDFIADLAAAFVTLPRESVSATSGGSPASSAVPA